MLDDLLSFIKNAASEINSLLYVLHADDLVVWSSSSDIPILPDTLALEVLKKSTLEN